MALYCCNDYHNHCCFQPDVHCFYKVLTAYGKAISGAFLPQEDNQSMDELGMEFLDNLQVVGRLKLLVLGTCLDVLASLGMMDELAVLAVLGTLGPRRQL